jgi:phosphoribosylaminoimidazolecarboxamide formyltransferase/IMP cyclohydrolase
VKHVKSNAIVYACKDRTLGIGAGQMSRVDASRIAIWKAADAGLSLAGSAVAATLSFPSPMVSSRQRKPARPAPYSQGGSLPR